MLCVLQVWQQGDAEVEAGYEPEPVFDRRQNAGLQTDQVGFFQGMVLPLYGDLCAAFPGTAHVYAQAVENHQHWVHSEAASQSLINQCPITDCSVQQVQGAVCST